MSVQVVMDEPAGVFFKDRAMAAAKALETMEGVKDANITVQRSSAASVVEFYAFNASCEATSLPVAVAAMEATLKTMSEGLLHTVRRAPIAEEERDFLMEEVHFMGYVRASLSNAVGERAAAQRGHGGPDVV